MEYNRCFVVKVASVKTLQSEGVLREALTCGGAGHGTHGGNCMLG